MKLAILILMLPFVVPIVLVVIFFLLLILKGKKEGWKGEVIDKTHNTKRDDEYSKRMNHFYSLRIRMEDGKERNIAVASEFYQSCNVGDIIEKPKGALYPKKV